MKYLLDNKKIFIIVGIFFLIVAFVMIMPDNNIKTVIPVEMSVIVGSEPSFFNKEIYTMPNGKGDPYILYGSNYNNSQPRLGFERLMPNVDNIQKINTFQGYVNVG